MRLSTNETQVAYYAVAGFIRHMNITRRPVQPEVAALYRRLDDEFKLSCTRHQTGCGEEDLKTSNEETWIGSPEVAQMLGRTKRQVQRIASHLGGQIIGGRWLFKLSAIEDYVTERNSHG